MLGAELAYKQGADCLAAMWLVNGFLLGASFVIAKQFLLL
jgi:hypothetical protein